MGSVRTLAQLPLDFPIIPFNLVDTITKIDHYAVRGALSGAGLGQALAWAGQQMDIYSEAQTAPTAAYTGTAGAANNFYAAVPEYPIVPVSVGTIATDAAVLQSPPLQGRGANGLQRSVRYGLPTPVRTVGSCFATLGLTNFVTVTAPTYSGAYSALPPTWSIVKPDGFLTIGGTYHIGDSVNLTFSYSTTAGIVTETVSHIVTAGDTNLAGIVTSMLSAVRLDSVANPLVAVSAGVTGTVVFFFVKNGTSNIGAITISATVTGAANTVTAVVTAGTNGALIGGGVVKSGVASASAATIDYGPAAITSNGYPGWANTVPIWPPHSELGVVPATAATMTWNFNATTGNLFAGGAGQIMAYAIGTQHGTYTTVSGDTTLAIALTSLAAAMQTQMRLGTGTGYTSGTVVATATALTVTWGATGPGGNDIPVDISNTTVGAQTFMGAPFPAQGLGASNLPGSYFDGLSGGIATGIATGCKTQASPYGF